MNNHVDYKGLKPKHTVAQMLNYLFSSVFKRKGLVIGNVLLLTVIAGLDFIVPQFTSNIVNHIVDQKSSNYLVGQIGLMLVVVLLSGILSFLSTYLMQKLSLTSIADLRIRLYKFVIGQDFGFFQNTKTGDLMTRMTGDVSNMQSLISSDTFGIVGSIFTFVAVLIFLFIKNWQLALLVSLTFPLLFIAIRFFRAKMSAAFAKFRSNQSVMGNQLQSTLTQIELIKNYTTENKETDEFKDVVDEGNEYQLEATTWGAIFTPVVTIINTLGLAIVLYVGGISVMGGKMNIGELVAYTQYLTILQNPIRSFSQIINRVQNALISFDRISELMEVEAAVVDKPNAKKFPKTLKNGISLKHVFFKYETTSADALEDVTFDIPVGKTTALVGRSGSGKSTIIRLLTRMYDRQSGEIDFDNLDIEDIKIKSLRENISVVSQDVTIVDGTVRENIEYGSSNVSDKKIMAAAKLADIDEFIQKLPEGLNTQVGERGIKLSGGQKQRLSIARALLKDAPIVILDEATAALDNESEKTIQHALDNLIVKKTSIVIAHRLSTIHNADQIVVMNDGEVVEIGTHASLIKHKNGAYKKLYDAQFE
ncbi:MAG: ABC transporter ATP-binding protein/permease [Lactobacillaceae bacterium]|jgi:subfamily B ATP-binding cassette protein MsbA|nr:ABC transporter ATP-binding protein/permease [Lactobacillaceae bacterium]